MKYLKCILLITLFSCLIFSCEKQDIYFKTQGELLGEEILRQSMENNITECEVYTEVNGFIFLLHNNKKFSIDKGVLNVENNYFNLEYLLAWTFEKSGGVKYITFYFPENYRYNNPL